MPKCPVCGKDMHWLNDEERELETDHDNEIIMQSYGVYVHDNCGVYCEIEIARYTEGEI